MTQEAMIYTIRPDGTALWLPASLCARMGIQRGDTLTAEQYEGAEIQRLLMERGART